MEIRHLRCFVAVADNLSFARAAERLHFATSHVSQLIAQLERELGVKLFDRSHRQVSLTPAGETLRSSARRVLEEIDELTETARRSALGESGSIHGSFCPGTGDIAGELVRAVTLQRPDIGLVFEGRRTAEATRAVVKGESQIGISRLVDGQLDSLVVTRHPRSYLAMPEGHHLEHRPRLSLHDLEGEDYLIVEPENTVFYEEAIQFFEGAGVHPVLRPYPLRSVEEAIELVAVRQGLILVTRREVVHYPVRGIVFRSIEGEVPFTDHFLIWRRDAESELLRYIVTTAERLVPILNDM